MTHFPAGSRLPGEVEKWRCSEPSCARELPKKFHDLSPGGFCGPCLGDRGWKTYEGNPLERVRPLLVTGKLPGIIGDKDLGVHVAPWVTVPGWVEPLDAMCGTWLAQAVAELGPVGLERLATVWNLAWDPAEADGRRRKAFTACVEWLEPWIRTLNRAGNRGI
jgi:hypothetical protein